MRQSRSVLCFRAGRAVTVGRAAARLWPHADVSGFVGQPNQVLDAQRLDELRRQLARPERSTTAYSKASCSAGSSAGRAACRICPGAQRLGGGASVPDHDGALHLAGHALVVRDDQGRRRRSRRWPRAARTAPVAPNRSPARRSARRRAARRACWPARPRWRPAAARGRTASRARGRGSSPRPSSPAVPARERGVPSGRPRGRSAAAPRSPAPSGAAAGCVAGFATRSRSSRAGRQASRAGWLRPASSGRPPSLTRPRASQARTGCQARWTCRCPRRPPVR